ncbi:tape measure protein [Veillonella sp. VA137]|uniref:tape measure protein n=1 Tax=Veillonella sp. VA137 TaxID=741828 RepID=UPI000F8DAC31|nr:tape measure protein [Veillonella sp. VA137]
MATITNYINLSTNIPAVAQSAANGMINLANGANNATGKMQQFINVTNSAKSGWGGFLASFTGNFFADLAMRGISMVTGAISSLNQTANEFNSIQARLNLVTGDQANAVALNKQIYDSAIRARGGYMEMAESVTQLSMSAHDAFPDPREAVGFMEGIQKLFVIGGASKASQKNAMLQLTQGMASGQLQGDEFRSIAENAPIIENMIAKTMGVSRGELKQLAADGKVTSEVIKKSIMDNMPEIEAQFAKMPKTFDDHMTELKNRAINAFTPVFERLKDFGNSEVMGRMFDGIANAIEYVAPFFYWLVGVAEWAMSGITTAFGAVSDFLSENFGIVEVALGILAGVIAYYATMSLISAANTAIAMGAVAAKTVVDWAETAAIIAMEAAQYGLNAAIALCPITWIVGGIILLIGLFYLAVAGINYFAGTSISATGIIFGAFAWLWAGIRNTFTFVWNLVASVANFLANVFQDPLAAIYNLFSDIWSNVVDLIATAVNSSIDLIKKIPGMSLLIGNAHVTADDFKFSHAPVAGGEKTIMPKMEMVNAADYASAGYAMGENLFNFEMPTPTIPEYKAKEMEGTKKDGTPKDSKAGKETANNTKRMADAVEMTADEIKELRESAVQSALNQFNQSHVIVNVDMDNNISNEMELDGVTSKLLDGIRNAVGMKREGVAM